MPELWYPKANRIPGEHADYEAGHNKLLCGVAHYTVGRNSHGTLGRDFTVLFNRDGSVDQGCPLDALVWHAGDPWNGLGFGMEAEYLPGYDDADGDGVLDEDEDILTDAQLGAIRDFVLWAHVEHHVPLEYYDGPRIGFFAGIISHRSLIQTGAYHSDYWPRFDWDAMLATPVAPTEGGLMWAVYFKNLDGSVTFHHGVGSVIVMTVRGPEGLYGLPSAELAYVKWNGDGIACRAVTADKGLALERVSAKAVA